MLLESGMWRSIPYVNRGYINSGRLQELKNLRSDNIKNISNTIEQYAIIYAHVIETLHRLPLFSEEKKTVSIQRLK